MNFVKTLFTHYVFHPKKIFDSFLKFSYLLTEYIAGLSVSRIEK